LKARDSTWGVILIDCILTDRFSGESNGDKKVVDSIKASALT